MIIVSQVPNIIQEKQITRMRVNLVLAHSDLPGKTTQRVKFVL